MFFIHIVCYLKPMVVLSLTKLLRKNTDELKNFHLHKWNDKGQQTGINKYTVSAPPTLSTSKTNLSSPLHEP